MDAGGLAQMSHPGFMPSATIGMPSSGLASRRGGQTIKPLSFDALKSPSDVKDNGVPTPRTSRSHLLAGLRTAPKSAAAATFPGNNPASPTTANAPQARSRNIAMPSLHSNENLYNGPKTSMPRYGTGQQQQGYNSLMGYGKQQYTADQVLAPPEIHIEEHGQEHADPSLQAQLHAANAYLTKQQQMLQQQLLSIQAAAQQFQGMNLSGMQPMQQAYQSVYQQQQQLLNAQQMMTASLAQQGLYTVVDPMSGQTYLVDQATAAQLPQFQAQLFQQQQQQQQQHQLNPAYAGFQQQQQQQPAMAPRLQVTPPPAEQLQSGFRNPSPPRRFASPIDNPAPLPPPSANAFRRGHKKSSSLVGANGVPLSVSVLEPPKSAGPKTANFPLSPLPVTGYGPGQARAGEHPVRQPRGPPSFDELAAKPTAKHEGSKNFSTRTRRSAVHNLVRAGLERRKGSGSASGSISPISESAEESLAETPMTDNESDSGRSGSGSLNGDVDDGECSLPSSRTSTGSWGAIGSDRPISRQKTRNSVDSNVSDSETRENGSFASLLKHSQRAAKTETDGQRRAPMLVLTSAEKRNGGAPLFVA